MLCQVTDRKTASEFLMKYDQVMSTPAGHSEIHRVTHYLAGDGPGCLGAEFRMYATGGPLSPTLRTEITAYQLCVLDDGIQESPHALVSRLATGATQSGPSWWSATIRMQQNIQVKKDIDAIAPNRFAKLFRSWKIMAQPKWYRYQQFIPKRIQTPSFLDIVYRTGIHNRSDWKDLKAHKAPQLIQRQRTEVTAIDEVKVDFFKRFCPPGRAITYQEASYVGSLDTLGRDDVSGHSSNLQLEPVCFQVISYAFVGKKYVNTDYSRKMRGMLLPAIVQVYKPWKLSSFPCEQLDVFTQGEPIMVDIARWVPFSFHKTLCRWTMSPSDIQGAWSFADPENYVDTQWRSSTNPTGH